MDNKNEKEILSRLKKETMVKDEIISKSGGLTLKVNKEAIGLVALIALVFISGVQTIKLSGLSAGNANAAITPVTTSPSSSGSSALPASLKNLPSQVGGC